MINISRIPITPVRIGRVGENRFKPIEFDIISWKTLFPNGTVAIVFERPDGMLYPVIAENTENVVSWLPSSADLSVKGNGRLEVRIYDGDVIGKSAIVNTITSDALGTTGQVPEQPKPDFVDEVIEKADEILAYDQVSVKFAPQTLTEEQKAQARENIGAGTGGGSTDFTLLDSVTLYESVNSYELTNLENLKEIYIYWKLTVTEDPRFSLSINGTRIQRDGVLGTNGQSAFWKIIFLPNGYVDFSFIVGWDAVVREVIYPVSGNGITSIAITANYSTLNSGTTINVYGR